MHPLHRETHLVARIGWLRAAVLGANDGIISTASLMVGIAASAQSATDIVVAGVAGLVAGAMSMAAGEYVSVSSQADTERADMDRERRELAAQPELNGGTGADLCEARRRAGAGAGGRHADDGEGCLCGPCARRAWPHRGIGRPSGSGGFDLRRYLFSRSRHSANDRCPFARR